MRSSFIIGRIFGIPIGINYSWFIIFFLITVMLSTAYFPLSLGERPMVIYWVIGLATSVLFFASVVAHELAHSLVSKRHGIPVKSITLFIFGGVARISREVTSPGTELVMAAAGPLSSVALAGIFYGIWALAANFEPVAAMAWYLCFINLFLACFNMVPGFPLDGGRVLRSIVWWRTGDYLRSTRIASLAGRGFAYLFIAVGLFFSLFVALDFLWLVLVGFFLEVVASASYRQAVVRNALQSYTAAQVMSRDCSVVPGGLALRQLVDDYFLHTTRKCVLVSDLGRLKGTVSLREVKTVPQQRWETTTVAEAMIPVEKLKPVAPDEEALEVLQRMDDEGVHQLPVVSAGRVLGLVERESLLQFVSLHSTVRS